MSEIDWSKAPEGAEFAGIDEGTRNVIWYKDIAPDGYFFFYPSIYWGWTRNPGTPCCYPLTPRPTPTTWRGPEDGLPPVGTKAIVAMSAEGLGEGLARFAGVEVQILAHFNTDRGPGVVVNHKWRGVCAMLFSSGLFRPLQSEREKAIERMRAIFLFPNYEDGFEALYDAGYRLMKEQK